MTDYETKAIEKFEQSVLDGKWSKRGLVHLFEVVGIYGNLYTISDYAKLKGLTYNGVKKTREVKEISGVKFVID